MKTQEAVQNARAAVMEMIAGAGGGHAGASLSIMEILGVLYFDVMHWDMNDPEHDRFLLSKGHAGLGLYAMLAQRGLMDPSLLGTFAGTEGPLMNHPDAHRIPGVEISTGSLGHGLSLATGMALAARMKMETHRVYCLLGDSECHEGSVWEAAMYAAHEKLGHLVAVVDENHMGNDGVIQVSVAPLAQKWMSFGWKAHEVDGHDVQALRAVFRGIAKEEGAPSVVIAHTQKGRGLIPEMAGTPACHYLKGNAADIRAMFDSSIREEFHEPGKS